MRTVFVLLISLIFVTSMYSQEASELVISKALDKWHADAATANGEEYFEIMDDGAIYIGTDKTEYWNKNEFQSWSKKYFDAGKAWSFKVKKRNIYFSSDKKVAWFDELLETWMGDCRASGVVELKNGEWKLKHYHLSVTVPNEDIKEFIKLTSEK